MLVFPWNKPNSDGFISTPVEVLNQGISNKCEAYAATSIGEDFFKVKIDPEVTYANALKITNGDTPTIEDVLNAVVRYGFDSDSGLRGKTFSPVWGFESNFENILGAIGKGYPVIFGLYWQQEWDLSPVISSNFQGLKFTPHAMKAFGMKTINGVKYIAALNSRGSLIGDSGIFYIGPEIELISPYIIKF